MAFVKLGAILILIFLVGIPTRVVQALPPPDLIISVSQSILNVLGALTAMLVLAFATLRTYMRAWARTLAGKAVLVTLIIGICLSGGVGTWLYLEDQKMTAWRAQVDAELREIWGLYDPVYTAKNERDAQAHIESRAREVTWSEFVRNIEGREYLVVDIRDRYPYELGHVPGSLHIRFADLLQGEWEQLLDHSDKPIFIVCYAGTTGMLSAEFLSARGFTELYQPEGGITEEVVVRGDIPFVGKATLPFDLRFENRIPLSDAKRFANIEDVSVVDLRSSSQYNEPTDIPTDIPFFREKATQQEIDQFVATLDADRHYLLYCNSDASCYSARIMLHDFDRVGKRVFAIYDARFKDGHY